MTSQFTNGKFARKKSIVVPRRLIAPANLQYRSDSPVLFDCKSLGPC